MLNPKTEYDKTTGQLSPNDNLRDAGNASKRKPGPKVDITSLAIDAKKSLSCDPYNRIGQFCVVRAESDE